MEFTPIFRDPEHPLNQTSVHTQMKTGYQN